VVLATLSETLAGGCGLGVDSLCLGFSVLSLLDSEVGEKMDLETDLFTIGHCHFFLRQIRHCSHSRRREQVSTTAF
jgi:hypothetical protein